MKPKIDFKVDRKKVTEGEVVEINWNCPDADTVLFTLDNGFRKTDLPLERSGSKKFRLNRSQGPTNLVITASSQGRTSRKILSVKVRKLKPIEAEYTSYKRMDEHKFKEKWNEFRRRMKMSWNMLTPVKQLACKVLGLLMLMMTLTAISPRLMTIGMMLTVFYLMTVLFRR